MSVSGSAAPPREPVAWLFNLDAEDELDHGPRYTRSRAMEARVATHRTTARALMAPDDHLFELAPAGVRDRGWGVAWCPTDRARCVFAASGTRPALAPPESVLRRVNDRRFCAALGQHLEGAVFVDSARAAFEHLGHASGVDEWLVKRAFGVAGRGRRRIDGSAIADADRAFVAASFVRGNGLQIEPWVHIELDLAQHGFITPRGQVELGVACVCECDGTGAFRSARRADPADITDAERVQLHSEADRVAYALQRAGYWGPFCVDAYRRVDRGGQRVLVPRSEINARFSMAFRVGFGDRADAAVATLLVRS